MLAGAPLLLEATVIKQGDLEETIETASFGKKNQRFEICYYDFSHEENKSNYVSLNFCTIHSSYQYEKATPSELGIFTHRHCEALLLCLIAQ